MCDVRIHVTKQKYDVSCPKLYKMCNVWTYTTHEYEIILSEQMLHCETV